MSKYTAKDLYIAFIAGPNFTMRSHDLDRAKQEALKKAVSTGRVAAQDEARVADFEKQFDTAMNALDVEEDR